MDGELDGWEAKQANLAAFDEKRVGTYSEGAPHLLHEDISEYLNALMTRALEIIPKSRPSVLDLGAGEGAVTRRWLERNVNVTAVDLSGPMLARLEAQCQGAQGLLNCIVSDVNEYLSGTNDKFDIISCISFLHHIPDYTSLIANAAAVVRRPGVFIALGDPLRYDTLRFVERYFQLCAYGLWRLRRPDAWGGLFRRMRRMRGIYLDDSVYDNAEYHVTRNGVDQNAIAELLTKAGFRVEIHPYWSTQASLGQSIGRYFSLTSDFAVFAIRD